MQFQMVSRNNVSFVIGYYRYDAFGNALGNSIVGKIQQTKRDKKLAAQQEFDGLKKQYK